MDDHKQKTEPAHLTHDEASEILSSLLVGMAERGETSPGLQRIAERAYAEIHRVEQIHYRREISPPTRTQEPPRSLIQRTFDTVNEWLGRGDVQQQKAFDIEVRDRARSIAKPDRIEALVRDGLAVRAEAPHLREHKQTLSEGHVRKGGTNPQNSQVPAPLRPESLPNPPPL